MAAARPPGLMESDFDTIEAAVMETQRGRWFLAEYARRNRAADTLTILAAMARLEGVVADTRAASPAAVLDAFAATAAQIAERLHDIGWDLRERGFSDDICAAVDRQAAAVSGLAARLAGSLACESETLPPASGNSAPPVLQSSSQRGTSMNALAEFDALPLSRKLEIFV